MTFTSHISGETFLAEVWGDSAIAPDRSGAEQLWLNKHDPSETLWLPEVRPSKINPPFPGTERAWLVGCSFTPPSSVHHSPPPANIPTVIHRHKQPRHFFFKVRRRFHRGKTVTSLTRGHSSIQEWLNIWTVGQNAQRESCESLHL